MTNEEKLHMIEDVLELDENTLTPEMVLADIEEYDSMSKLSLIVMIDDECHKKLTGEQLREFVGQRRATTLRVAAEIVARQQAFFRRGVAALRPMTMEEVASAMGVNETTVSRAVKGRWMRTPRGNVEFRAFFTAGVSSAAAGSSTGSEGVGAKR